MHTYVHTYPTPSALHLTAFSLIFSPDKNAEEAGPSAEVPFVQPLPPWLMCCVCRHRLVRLLFKQLGKPIGFISAPFFTTGDLLGVSGDPRFLRWGLSECQALLGKDRCHNLWLFFPIDIFEAFRLLAHNYLWKWLHLACCCLGSCEQPGTISVRHNNHSRLGNMFPPTETGLQKERLLFENGVHVFLTVQCMQGASLPTPPPPL